MPPGSRDVVEGIFAVQRRDRDALVVVNLVDELSYRVHSNLGPGAFAQMPPGCFLVTRLVPIADERLLSGLSSILPAAYHTEARRLATELMLRRPALAFRNPKKLEQAWEFQRK